MSNIDRERLIENGWALGSVFTSDSAPMLYGKIEEGHKSNDEIFIAITHDCSVVRPCLLSEPFLEYLSIKRIDDANGLFTNARNIRKLHLELKKNGEPVWYEASMASRGFVCRDSLESDCPDADYHIEADSLNVMKRWLANRYVAQTFPDRFNELVNGLVKSSKSPLIKAFSDDTGRCCHSVFISLSPDDRDIEDGESYDVTLVLLFRDEIAQGIGREALEEYARKIQGILEVVEYLEPVQVFALDE